MGRNTTIAWCDHTFNPWEGCTKVSPGCANCYAETRNARFGGGVALNWGLGRPRRRTSASNWKQPIKWNREASRIFVKDGGTLADFKLTVPVRPRVFCASLSDWLDTEAPSEWLADLLILIADTAFLDWLLLTKRPESWLQRMYDALEWLEEKRPELVQWVNAWISGTPPTNVWLGTSVENQKCARERIPRLLKIPAKTHFLSCEPILGPINLSIDGLWKHTCEKSATDFIAHADDGKSHPAVCRDQADRWMDARADAQNVDWVIIGGESGFSGHCRRTKVDWIAALVAQCREAGVATFVKQLGSQPFSMEQPLGVHAPRSLNMDVPPVPEFHWILKDKKGGDMAEWPAELQIREFPK